MIMNLHVNCFPNVLVLKCTRLLTRPLIGGNRLRPEENISELELRYVKVIKIPSFHVSAGVGFASRFRGSAAQTPAKPPATQAE